MVGQLDPNLWAQLQRCCSDIRTMGPRETLSKAGEPLDKSALLLEGIMARYVRGPANGASSRAMVSIQVPGDFIDLHGLPMKVLDHDIGTLTQVRIAMFPHAKLDRIIAGSPDHARALWRLTMIEASVHRHWLFRTNRLRALASMADFICEMDQRLRHAGEVDGACIPLPLLQLDLAEITGLSTVHISRVIRDLRESGLCTVRDGHAEIHDRERLRALAGYDPSYLYLPAD
ncbi:MAG: Crp/Fnr family transcriptional regulator [Roseovarius sp.]